MSKKENAAEFTPESASVDGEDSGASISPNSPRRSGLLPGLLALVLAVCALGLSLWLWLAEVDVDDDADAEAFASVDALAAHDSRLSAVEQSIDSLAGTLDEVAGELEAFDIEAAAARQELRELSREVRDDMEARLDALESQLVQAVERLQQVSGEQRAVDQALEHRLFLLEAAGLLRMGQERAELAGDFSGARAAYRRASSHLRQVDDPRLNRARGLLARELEALENVSEPDWVAMAGRLTQIGSQADQWPGVVNESDRSGEAPSEASETGWWGRLKTSLDGLVRVRPRGELPVTPEQIDAIREQIRLRLLSAELAIARRDSGELGHHASEARAMIRNWFDTSASSVERALEQLKQLGDTPAAEVPPLGEALAEVNRQLEAS